METEREIGNFVSVYGTGSQIPDPPAFVNYQSPDATPSSAVQPTFRSANFTRSSARDVSVQLHRNILPHEEELVNIAGRGAGGGGAPRRVDTYPETNTLARQPTQRNSVYGVPQQQQQQQQQQLYANGVGPGHSSQKYSYQNQINSVASSSMSSGVSATLVHRPVANTVLSSQPQSYHRPSPSVYDPHAGPIDPTAETYIKVGNNAYKVDPSKDPQMNPGASGNGSGLASRAGSSVTKQNGIDPLQKQLEELQSGLSAFGSNRRNTIHRQSAGPSSENSVAGSSRHKGNDLLAAGGTLFRSPVANSPSPVASGSGSQQVRDYKNSAELVVGAPPQTNSRPSSPNPPTANFMIPKNANGNHGAEVVTDVLADYHQHLPGERNSRRVSSAGGGNPGPGGHGHSLSVSSQQGQGLARTPSIGHAGIGAHGGNSRGNSPQPSASRGPSPGPGEIVRLGNTPGHPSPQPQPQQHQVQHQSSPQQKRNSTFITSPSIGTPVRDTSPNPVGIALDLNGRVSHDEMAQRYQMQQQQKGQIPQGHQHTYGGIQQQSQHPQQAQQQRRSSWLAGVSTPGAPQPSIAPPVQPTYSPMTPPPPQVMNMYQVPPPPPIPQTGYMTPAPGQGMYNQYSQQPSTGFQQSTPQQQQPQNAYAMVNSPLVTRQQRPSGNGFNGGNVPSSQASSSLAIRNGGGDGYRVPSPGPGVGMHVGRSPSPQSMVQQVLPQIQQVHQLASQAQQIPMTHQYQSMQQVSFSAPQSVQQQMQGQGQLSHGRFGAPPQQQIGQTTEDGKQIMFYGMSFVFVFLFLLSFWSLFP